MKAKTRRTMTSVLLMAFIIYAVTAKSEDEVQIAANTDGALSRTALQQPAVGLLAQEDALFERVGRLVDSNPSIWRVLSAD